MMTPRIIDNDYKYATGRDKYEKVEVVLSKYITEVLDLPMRAWFKKHGDGASFPLSHRCEQIKGIMEHLMNILRAEDAKNA